VFFKRFEWGTGVPRKIKGEVTVPFDEMDLTPYLHKIAQKNDKPTYKMIAHIDHQGELNSGHYTAISKSPS
jgi:ubiquitin C-terminal hydrolase